MDCSAEQNLNTVVYPSGYSKNSPTLSVLSSTSTAQTCEVHLQKMNILDQIAHDYQDLDDDTDDTHESFQDTSLVPTVVHEIHEKELKDAVKPCSVVLEKLDRSIADVYKQNSKAPYYNSSHQLVSDLPFIPTCESRKTLFYLSQGIASPTPQPTSKEHYDLVKLSNIPRWKDNDGPAKGATFDGKKPHKAKRVKIKKFKGKFKKRLKEAYMSFKRKQREKAEGNQQLEIKPVRVDLSADVKLKASHCFSISESHSRCSQSSYELVKESVLHLHLPPVVHHHKVKRYKVVNFPAVPIASADVSSVSENTDFRSSDLNLTERKLKASTQSNVSLSNTGT